MQILHNARVQVRVKCFNESLFSFDDKNVVYLDRSDKQNLSTLRKTYADDNNVVSSLRSLTTYHYHYPDFEASD